MSIISSGIEGIDKKESISKSSLFLLPKMKNCGHKVNFTGNFHDWRTWLADRSLLQVRLLEIYGTRVLGI